MAVAWRTVRVFISSTFRDMHAERDHLVKVVFPALRERLEKHRVYLIDIDLRWGVTREQAENDQVLDLCLQEIDECRPFFLGILGERYGWVPTRYPADALKKFGWIQQHTGKSVTELEILHGVLQNRQMRGRAFFYFRDPVSLRGVPEALRQSVFADTDPECIHKLDELKRQIRFSGYPVMENYPARWDPEAHDRPSRLPGRLVGLEAFGERVRDQLWQAIQEEFQLPEQPPVVTAADPLAEEQDYHERFMESRLRVYVGREQINDALLAFADGNDPVPCLVTGPSGSGKSAALTRFVRDYQHQRPQTLVIPHFIGASPRSTNLRDMLRRFCQVFKARFGFAEEVPEEAAKLSVTFREFAGKVPADARVLLVIDALNQLDETDRAQELYWLPAALPPQVKVIISCITDSGKMEPVLEAFRRRKHCPVQLAALSDAEQRLIIRQVPSLSAKTLDDDQVRLLLSNQATAHPLFLLVALEELRGFACYERLNERIAAFPREGDTVTDIFIQVIERLAEEFNQELVETVLALLASARRGLSEQELQELVAGLDGADDLFPVLRQLRPYLLSRAGLIDFYHRNLFKAVRERCLASEEQQRQAHVRLAEYFNAQDYWLESLEEQQRWAKTLPPSPRPANVRKVDELPWQLLQAADWQRSEQLLTDLAFLEAKAEAGMVFDLAADFSAVIGGMPADLPLLRILRLLEEALRRDIHFIARHPTTLFQCLWNLCWWYDCPESSSYYESGSDHTSLTVRDSSSPTGVTLCGLLDEWRARKERAAPFRWLRSLRPPDFPLDSPQVAILREHVADVRWMTFSPDGQTLVSVSDKSEVRLWHVHTCTQVWCYDPDYHITFGGVAFSPDGTRIAVAMEDAVHVIDAYTGQLVQLVNGHDDTVSAVAFSRNGDHLITGSFDESLRLWNATSGKQELCLEGFPDYILCICPSSDGRSIAVGTGVYAASVWMCDLQTGSRVRCLESKDGEVDALALSPDGNIVATAVAGDPIKLWNAASGVLLKTFSHPDVFCLSWSPDGSRLVSGGNVRDRTIRVWNVLTGKANACYHCRSSVNSVSFAPDSKRVAVGFSDATVQLWDITRKASDLIVGHSGDVYVTELRADLNLLATGSYDRTVQVWNTRDGRRVMKLTGHEGSVSCVSFSRDGRLLVSGSSAGEILVWELPSRRIKQRVCFDVKDWVTSVAISRDGKSMVSGGLDGMVRVWNIESGRELRQFAGHHKKGVGCSVTAVAFCPHDRFVASGAHDVTVRLWEIDSGKEVSRCRIANAPTRLSFADDSRLVITSRGHSGEDRGEHGEIVWDTRTDEMTRLPKSNGRWQIDKRSRQRSASTWHFAQRIFETTIQERQSSEPAAWFPMELRNTWLTGGLCAASDGALVWVIRLEGFAESDG